MPALAGVPAELRLTVHERVAKFVYLKAWPLMLSLLYGWCGIGLLLHLCEKWERWYREDYAFFGSPYEVPWGEILRSEAGPGLTICLLVLMAAWIFPFGKRPRSTLRGTGVLHRGKPVHLSRRQRLVYGTMSALCFALAIWLLNLLTPYVWGYKLINLASYYDEYEFFPGLALLWLSWVVYPYEGQWDPVPKTDLDPAPNPGL
ncbi:MAG TPA: hypothetical protein VG796_14090 [Verrucomicrobiales bacterium]|jgi:hypothetical protein|nr:hypothetical protein [Verrucomicrobiales bacterium]